jgi:hypothetical protein
LQECEQDEHGFSWQDIVLFDDHAPLNGRGAGWKKAGYRQVSITHGLPIPTGIGMSTTMRFHMDEENHGQSILNRVAPVLFKYEPKLNELGVDLDRDYLERIKHATADHKKLDELFNSQEIDVMPLYG